MPAGPERAARDSARAMKSSAGAKVVHLAAAVVERPGAAADAAEVEAQHGAADARQRLRRLIHRLGVHRAAVLRVRMREHDGRARRRRRARRAGLERRRRAAGGSRRAGLEPHGRSRHLHAAGRARRGASDELARPAPANSSGLRDRAEVAGALERRRVARRQSARRYSRVPSTGTTRSSSGSPVTTSVGTRTRAQSSAQIGVAMQRAPAAPCAPATSGARDDVASCRTREPPPRAGPAIAAAISGRSRQRRLGEEQRPEQPRQPRSRAACRASRRHAGPRRRGEHQRARRAPDAARRSAAAIRPPNETPHTIAARRCPAASSAASTCST